MRACATKGIFFLGTTKMYAKKSSSIWPESELKNKSEARRKWETNVLNLDLGHKMASSFLFCALAPLEVKFLMGTIKRCAKMISLSCLESNLWKKVSEAQKSEKPTLWILIWVKKLQNIYFLNKCLRFRHKNLVFLGTTKRCTKK